jgi:hypothetical protein
LNDLSEIPFKPPSTSTAQTEFRFEPRSNHGVQTEFQFATRSTLKAQTEIPFEPPSIASRARHVAAAARRRVTLLCGKPAAITACREPQQADLPGTPECWSLLPTEEAPSLLRSICGARTDVILAIYLSAPPDRLD